MKLIIIEGGDRLGKSTLIENLCKHFNYDNVTIRHFGKPPKDLAPDEVLDFQFKCFKNEANLVHEIKRTFDPGYSRFHYYPEIVIWNRAHLGEYVYGQMFRKADKEKLKTRIQFYEKYNLMYKQQDDVDIYLITLTADPEFFASKEDGHSFSSTIEDKTRELELFKEAHELSNIEHKLLLKVDKEITELYYSGPGQFRPKEEIFQEVKNFINGKAKIS